MGSGDRLVLGGFERGSAAPEHLKPFVATGSVQSAKGEASDEDEETEYFDAMEDAPAFITVTADPKHHRYEPLPQDHALHGAIWRNLLRVREKQGRDGLPSVMLGLEGSTSPAEGYSVCMSPSKRAASPRARYCARLLLCSWSEQG